MINQMDFELKIGSQFLDKKKRRLDFTGTKNFRDLGGYRTVDGKTVIWGILYRSDQLQKLTNTDLNYLTALALDRIIDFRAEHEKEEAPDRIPANLDIRIVELPILDSSTEIWRDTHDQLIKDNLKSINSVKFMIETNIELATRFTPQMMQFVHELFSANGRPVLFHCAAGKDRTGFAAAILLRILGVPLDVVMEDYLLSNQYYLSAHSWSLFLIRLMKGKRFSNVVTRLLHLKNRYSRASILT